MSVVFAHSPWNGGFVFVGGRNAVQLFYMVSGFLISHVVCTNPTYTDARKFYLARWLRLFPIYYLVAVLTLALNAAVRPSFFELFRQLPASANALLIFANTFLFGQDWVMFSGIENGQLVFAANFQNSEVKLYEGLIVPPAWTLGVELTFYLLAPFILRSKKTLLTLLAGSVLVRLCLIAVGVGLHDPWTYRFFPAELAFFVLGALSNQYLLPWWKKVIKTKGVVLVPTLGTYGFVLLSLGYFLIPGPEGVKTSVMFILFFALLPLTFLYQSGSANDRAIGELSYPIYIGHMLVITTWGMFRARLGVHDPLAISLINVVAAIAFAFLINYLLGDRIETLRERIRGGTPTAAHTPTQSSGGTPVA